MNKTELDRVPADTELDAALAQMAEEVPPMPADFHDRWMNAVRAEAKAASPDGGETARKDRTAAMVRWTRILSVAAVFVFLIGGTLLYRNSKKALGTLYASEKREAEPDAAPAAGVDAEEAGAEVPVTGDAFMPVMEEAAEYEDDGKMAENSSLKAAGAVQNSLAVSAEEPVMEAEAAMEEADMEEAAEAPAYAGEADYAAEASSYAALPAMTSAPTAEPTATPTATAAPTGTPEPTAAPGPEAEETGFLQAAGGFFTDMGDFLLAALPYLLVLAVPAAAALVIRRKKAGGPGQK